MILMVIQLVIAVLDLVKTLVEKLDKVRVRVEEIKDKHIEKRRKRAA